MNGTVGLVFNEDSKKEKFICPHCEKEFNSKAALTKHINKEHADANEEDEETEE